MGISPLAKVPPPTGPIEVFLLPLSIEGFLLTFAVVLLMGLAFLCTIIFAFVG